MAQSAAKRQKTALVLAGIVGGMVGLSFASVPLYELFCRVTGYGGTPKTEDVAAPSEIVERIVTVQFDANVNSKLPWRFAPDQRAVQVRIGEEALASYTATNVATAPVTGTATFSVTPYKAAPYFSKIACFCFTEQTLEAGESVSMPVSFYVDPDILDDPNTRDVKTITLSYTFFPAEPDGDDDGRAGS